MSFKEVDNIVTGHKTYFIDEKRVTKAQFEHETADLSGYNSSMSWTANGRRYHCFCLDK